MLYTLLKWVLYAFVIMFSAWLIPGIHVTGFAAALVFALVLALINTFIKPVLLIVTLPINILTLGLFSFVLNALVLMLAGYISPGFEVEGFWSAFFGAIVITILGGLVERVDNES